MNKYDFCVALWLDGESSEWFYSVIQEFDDVDPEPLLYGSHPDKEVALGLVSEFIQDTFR